MVGSDGCCLDAEGASWENGRTLFLCTAPDFHEDARKTAREGAILAVDVTVAHAGLP